MDRQQGRVRRLVAGLCLVSCAATAWAATDDLQAQFDGAVRAIEEGKLRTARTTLQDLLADNPSLHRARLELARVYYLSRDYAEARREAERVLDDPNTPPSVRTTVLAFLAQIAEEEKQFAQRHTFTPSIYAGLMYDSNVNIGPARDVIDIGPLAGGTIDPDSRPKSDMAWVINPALSHVYNPGRRFELGEESGLFLWQTDLSAYYRGYFDETDFNLGVLTLRTGPAWVVPGDWRAWIGLQGDQIWFGGDSLALFSSLNPGVTWEIGDATELTVEGALTDRNYWDDDDAGREGVESAAAVNLTRYFSNRTVAVQVGVAYSDFDADEARFGYQAPELHGGVIVEAWPGGVVYARIGYRNYDFGGTEPLFPGISRDDDEMRYAAGFEHDFRGGTLDRWSLQGSWIYTDNQSNVPIYEYDRSVVNLGMARNF
jgi:hypothetical protein